MKTWEVALEALPMFTPIRRLLTEPLGLPRGSGLQRWSGRVVSYRWPRKKSETVRF